ncbi:type IV toxin-antitoxin system AbiEi family antitoxin domain-containing protein [Xanthomonas sp. AmX2]|uniref:type IV toxin-antitoxin system AbiEi family antitoxin domain-containing protein n=1 Tax=Xanthomonas sp. TaxID=29446 RepID=UPI00197E480E|nr:type IV toxin-antitoxin system AbiEi family antitoxin domain-containing protein [Xanthomonas sp.]MBN6149211.1 type IV toxin-antitoxin system AbiEi family antitoxin domain-containing protein [Xanthomonas sp.]
MPAPHTAPQREQALALLGSRGMMRLREFGDAGITAATVSRLERDGAIVRLARGLYQLADASLDQQHSLAEVAKLIPKGIVCLTSALAFHGLTDQLPARVWVALGKKDWRPRIAYPPVRIVRFPPELLSAGVEHHAIEDIPVPVFGVAKTIADLFRYRRTVGEAVAIEGLREALRQHKTTPAEIARFAEQARIWKVMQPYLTTLTSHG